MAIFVLKFSHFRYRGNRGRSDVNFNDTLNWLTSKTACLVQHSCSISCICKVLANFVLQFPNFRCHGNRGRSDVTSNDTRKLLDLENPLFGVSYISIIMAYFVLKFPNFRYHATWGSLMYISTTLLNCLTL